MEESIAMVGPHGGEAHASCIQINHLGRLLVTWASLQI